MSAKDCAVEAAREAVASAREALGAAKPKLAVVFASSTYDDVGRVAEVLEEELGSVVTIGGTSGACVFGPERIATRGVSVVLVGGDDIEVEQRSAPIESPDVVAVVPAAEQIARAADDATRRGLAHYACLVFAPGVLTDGEALVAAVRKGAGARAQLAGGLTGDDLRMERPLVFADGELRSDRVVITGIFTRQPIGVAARHGYRAVGPARRVTRADGRNLIQLDGRDALDVWLEDAKRAGASLPETPKELSLYLASHYEIGLIDGPSIRSSRRREIEEPELVARAPLAIREDGVIHLSASIAEGTRVRVLHASRQDLLRASSDAASAAVLQAGHRVAGAIVLACSGRLAVLGDAFAEECARIRERIAAPVGGACVYGEIARNVRDRDAFFNTTAVVVAFAAA